VGDDDGGHDAAIHGSRGDHLGAGHRPTVLRLGAYCPYRRVRGRISAGVDRFRPASWAP
jgi:hypothetical protein